MDDSIPAIEPLIEQPHQVDIKMADDVFIKQIVVANPETYLPQHSHAYDHTSMIALGAVRVWEGGDCKGDFTAPCGLTIKACVKHMFMTLVPNTIIYCIHNVSRTGDVDLLDEHDPYGRV